MPSLRCLPLLAALALTACHLGPAHPDGGANGAPGGTLRGGAPCDAGPACQSGFCDQGFCDANCALSDGGANPALCDQGTTCAVSYNPAGCEILNLFCHSGGYVGSCERPCGQCLPGSSCSPDGTSANACHPDPQWDQFTADFDAPAAGYRNQQANFRARLSHAPDGVTAAAYDWDFGDGSAPGSGEQVQHAFAHNSTFTVSLTVTGSGGQRAQASHAFEVPCTADGGFCSGDGECCEGSVCFGDRCTPQALACVPDGGDCFSLPCCSGLRCDTFSTCTP